MAGTSFNLFNLNNFGKGAEFKPFSNPFLSGSNSTINFSNPFQITNPSPCSSNDGLLTMPLFESFADNKIPMDLQCEFVQIKPPAKADANADAKAKINTTLPTLQAAYNQDKGKALAYIAFKHAIKKNTKHQCLQGVRESLTKAGLVKGSMGISAYRAADILAKNNKFKEVSVERKDLKNLPAGCIIVWHKNNGGSESADKNGHIGITVGDGREVSDHVADSIYMFNSKHRVFVPIGIDKSF